MSVTEKTKLTEGGDEVNIHWCCNRTAEKFDTAQQSERPKRFHLASAPALPTAWHRYMSQSQSVSVHSEVWRGHTDENEAGIP